VTDGRTVRRSDGQTESIIANTALCIARAMLTRCKNAGRENDGPKMTAGREIAAEKVHF